MLEGYFVSESYKFNLPIGISRLSEEFKRDALLFANDLRFVFQVDGKREEYTPAEVDEQLIEGEARRIISLPTKGKRERGIAEAYWPMIHALRKAQGVIRAFLAQDSELQALFRFLETVTEVKVLPPENPPQTDSQS